MSDPVRVLMFGHDLHGRGTERSVVRLLRHFDRSVVQVTLALVQRRGEFLAGVPDDIVVHELAPTARRTSRALLPLVRLLRQEKPDCLLGVHTSPSRVVAVARMACPRRALICWEPDPFRRVEGDKGWYSLRRLTTSLTHRTADCILCPSDVVADGVVNELGIERSKITVLPHPCVDDDMLEAAKSDAVGPPFGEGVPVIVNIGNMHGHKSQDVLLRAFAVLRETTDARLVLIGHGPMETRLRTLAGDLAIEDDVHFLGFQSNPFKFLAAADLFVSTATSEGFDISQVEAMACGVPVVVTDGPRYRIVEDGITGRVVPTGDAGATAEAARALLTRSPAVDAMVARARGKALELHAAPVARQYEQLFVDVARGGRPR